MRTLPHRPGAFVLLVLRWRDYAVEKPGSSATCPTTSPVDAWTVYPRQQSDIDCPADTGLNLPADPDGLVHLLYPDPPTSADSRSLARQITLGQLVLGNQPLRQTGIQTAGHRVFSILIGHESTHLDISLGAGTGPAPPHANVESGQGGGVRAQCQRLIARGELHGYPAGAVIDPVASANVLRVDAHALRNTLQGGCIDGAAADQPGAALLNDIFAARTAAILKPYVTGARRAAPAQDPDSGVSPGVSTLLMLSASRSSSACLRSMPQR